MSAQYPIPLMHGASYAAQDYVVSDALEAVLAQLRGYADWPDPVRLLVGEKASGKTHLLHALAATIPVAWISDAMLGETPGEVLLKPALLNVVEACDTTPHPAALAQSINAARATQRALLLTSRSVPAAMPPLLPDLASRLKSLSIIALPTPDEALLASVMHKQFSDLQWRVAPEVVQYVVTRLPREFVALQHFIEAANHLGLARGRALTLPLAREVVSLVVSGEHDV